MRTDISIAARVFSTGISTVPLCAIRKAEKDHSGRDGDENTRGLQTAAQRKEQVKSQG
jgi:hypothetical protein